MPKLPWFRMYAEARMDAKLELLSDAEFRIWFRMLCYASEQEDRGSLSPEKYTSLAVQVSHGDRMAMNTAIQKLLDMDILSRRDDGGVFFSHFAERQYDKPSSHPAAVGERVRKHREMKRLVTPSNALVTPSNAERRVEEIREEDIRVEEKRVPANAAPPLSLEDRQQCYDAFKAWWTPEEIDQRIEEALNHKASKKAKNLYLYVRNWLRRDSEHLAPRKAAFYQGDKDREKWSALARLSPAEQVATFHRK